VATRVRSGLKELERAERYDRNTRPERCIHLLLSSIFVCFIILCIKHS
jgi:syntaxin 16